MTTATQNKCTRCSRVIEGHFHYIGKSPVCPGCYQHIWHLQNLQNSAMMVHEMFDPGRAGIFRMFMETLDNPTRYNVLHTLQQYNHRHTHAG